MTGRIRFCHWLKRLKQCHPSQGYLLVDFISVLNSLSFFVWEIWDNTANVCQVIKNSRLDRNGLFGVSLSLQINNSFLPSLQVEAHNSVLSHLLVCSGEISPTSNRIRDPSRMLYHEPFDWSHVCFCFSFCPKKAQSFAQQPLSGWHFTSLLFVFSCGLPTACHQATAFHAHLISY